MSASNRCFQTFRNRYNEKRYNRERQRQRQRQLPHYHDHFVIFAAGGFLFVQISMRMANVSYQALTLEIKSLLLLLL